MESPEKQAIWRCNEMAIKERYDNIDGFRVICCLGIIAMHIRANSNFQVYGVGGTIIASWTHFVPLFLMISGFGMCCGYYEQVKKGQFDLNQFYLKRYRKLLPFYIFLMFIDIVMDRSLAHIVEAFTQATLVFGLLPNNQPDVIGVSWTLGVIFLFYLLFPYFVWLCWNKKRAFISFGVSLAIALACSWHYFTDKFVIKGFGARHNILYCAPFFIGGGIIYLCRKEIKAFVSRYRWLWLTGSITLSIAWYFLPGDDVGKLLLKNSMVFFTWLMYGISVKSKILSNKVMRFLSEVSLEMYLAQMVIFRLIERTGMLYKLGDGWIGFIAIWIATIVGLLIFILLWKKGYSFIEAKLKKQTA